VLVLNIVADFYEQESDHRDLTKTGNFLRGLETTKYSPISCILLCDVYDYSSPIVAANTAQYYCISVPKLIRSVAISFNPPCSI
jgi:hypothetical protein